MSKSPEIRLPYGRQCIDDDDVAAVVSVLRSDRLTQGPVVAGFEQALAAALDVNHVVAVGSGTAALHAAACAAGIGAGDWVVVPTVTFLATANAVLMTGAEVSFADVNPRTGLMEVRHFEAAVERAGGPVKAVFPVHLNGQCVDLAPLRAAASERGCSVVEDACHALGGAYIDNGLRRKIGSCAYSEAAIYSFHPVKTIAAGEGGAVATNDESFADSVRRMRNHGMVHEPDRFEDGDRAFDDQGEMNPWYYEMQSLGWNYRMSDVHCALGLSQLGKLDRFVARRRELAGRYDERLEPLADLVRPIERVSWCEPGWHLYAVLVDFEKAGVGRGELMRALRQAGIGTQVHYRPVHGQPYYRRRYGELALGGAEDYYAHVLSLPLFYTMTSNDVDHVVDSLTRAIRTRR